MLRIKEIRKAKGITARELAELINVAESTMSLYENGKREPDIDTIAKIAMFLDVSLECLFGLDNKLDSDLTAPEKALLTVTKYFQEESEPKPTKQDELTEQEKTLLTVFRETTEEGRMEMIAAIINIKKAIEIKRASNSDSTLA